MKKRILTGIQTTAEQFHLWNYFGAVRPMLELAKDPNNEVFLFTANMHSFTVVQDWDALRKNTLNALKLFLAVSPTPETFFIYNPAMVPAHAQLTWVTLCLTNMWVLERMHAFKDKVQKWKQNEASVGLFTYPSLMAMDILLYDANNVPVWKDQKQHVEYTRDLAMKFNRIYGETFVIPEAVIQKDVAIVPGIDGQKMSKSKNNYIWLLDTEKQILKRVKQIATDAKRIEDPKNPDECNVYNILKLFLSPEENISIRKRYIDWGLSYKEVKDYLYEKIIEFVIPIQQKFDAISDEEVKKMLQINAKKANEIATKKVDEVYKKIGFIL